MAIEDKQKSRKDVRFFLIIAGAVLIGTVGAFAVKGIYGKFEDRQEAKQIELQRAQGEAAAAERARVAYINELKGTPSKLPKTWEEMVALKDDLQIDDQTMTALTVSWLKYIQDVELAVAIDEGMGKWAAGQDFSLEKERMATLCGEYNKGIKTLPQDIYEEKTTPKEGSITPELDPDCKVGL